MAEKITIQFPITMLFCDNHPLLSNGNLYVFENEELTQETLRTLASGHVTYDEAWKAIQIEWKPRSLDCEEFMRGLEFMLADGTTKVLWHFANGDVLEIDVSDILKSSKTKQAPHGRTRIGRPWN